MGGKCHGFHAQCGLPDGSLVATETFAPVLGGAKHVSGSSIGIDVHLGAHIAGDVPLVQLRDGGAVSRVIQHRSIVLEGFEIPVVPPLVFIEEIVEQFYEQGVCVGLHGHKQHPVFDAVQAKAPVRSLFQLDSHTLAVLRVARGDIRGY